MSWTRLAYDLAGVSTLLVLMLAASADDSVSRPLPHGLANYRQVSPSNVAGPRIDCGGQPEAESDFETLADRGIRVVVCVDGARPNAAAASRHGIRTIHLPVGYDGIDRETVAALTRVVHEVDHPIYVHCHHGRHRGPAAAAIAALAAEQIDAHQAIDVLRRAGTDPRYVGLWRDVQDYEPIGPDQPMPELVESSPVDPIVLEMIQLESALDGLRHSTDPTSQLTQLILLSEGYRESARHIAQERPALRDRLGEAELEINRLVRSLRDGSGVSFPDVAEQLNETCIRCHDQFRN